MGISVRAPTITSARLRVRIAKSASAVQKHAMCPFFCQSVGVFDGRACLPRKPGLHRNGRVSDRAPSLRGLCFREGDVCLVDPERWGRCAP